MDFLYSTIIKDLRRRMRDPWVLLLWFGIPFVIGAPITLITGGSGGPTPIAYLLVADQDKSLASAVLIGSFRSGPMQQMVEVEEVEQSIGEARIADGDGSALLVIPQGFGIAVLREEPTQLLLLTNPSQVILPRILEQALDVLIDGSFYLHRVFGEELRTITSGLDSTGGSPNVLPDPDIAQLSVSINQAVRRLTPYLFPPVIDVEVIQDEAQQAGGLATSFSFLIFPGIMLMAVLFTAQGLSEDYWREREQGTLRRLVSSPRSTTTHLAGKVLSGSVVMAGVCLFILIVGFLYHGLSFGKLPVALLWLVVGGLVFQNLLGLIRLYAPSRRSGALIVTLLISPLMMIGGSFFPFETMPSWMAVLGKLTPNGYIVEQLKNMLLDRHDPFSLVMAFLVLLAVSAILFLIGARRNQRVFCRS